MIIKRAKPLIKSGYRYDPCEHGVTQSMIAAWQSCHEKARINIVNGWSSGRPTMPFVYGTCAHAVVEYFLNAIRFRKIKTLDDAYRQLPQWIGDAEIAWRKENKKPSTEALDLLEEALAIITVVMPRYFKNWWEDDSAVEWMYVEEEFKVPLKMKDGKTVLMRGKFDGVFYHKGLRLFETKNKSMWSGQIMDLLPMDLQLGYYITALEHVKKNTVSGIRYNILRRPQEKRKETEKLKDYCARVEENISKKPDHYFVRFDIRLTRAETDEHRFRAEKLVEEFYQWWKNCDPQKRDLMWNSGSCESKYGTCGNLPICSKQDYSGHSVKESPSPELSHA